MIDVRIDPADPRAPDVLALLDRHLAFARLHSPPQAVHALPAAGLLGADIRLFAARQAATVVGVGALRLLEPGHAELKSMHTAAEVRGQGVGRAMVRHLLAVAAAEGVRRVSLETGAPEAFAPARTLYAAEGFVPCGPFGDYPPSTFSVFFTRELPASE